ncbi:MAG: hypothetical protein HY891_02755 [Deltaproteobacteria bacterium]|nr:hypothetical protein [Deltaproteobacteria bacterium]
MFKIALLVFLSAFLPFDAYGRDKVLNILYTGAIKGELEPCGCSPKTDSGGLARLSGYISANRADLEPYVLLDAGNSTGEDTPQGRLKTEAVLKSFAVIGYDAVAFFKDDNRLLESFFSPLIEKSGTPAVSESAPYPGSIPVEDGSFKINISADPKGYNKGRLNILLTDRPLSEAGSIRGWEVIVTSSGELLEEPVRTNGTIIVSGYAKGKMLGVLTLQMDSEERIAGFTHRWQPLGKEIKEDMNVRNVLNEYDAKVAALLKDEERKVISNGPYLGYSSCAECHPPFLESWKRTRHAGAFRSLEDAGKSRDPECVKCHSTGYGEEGGFYSATSTPGLANVQCEQCHGPGRGHLSDYAVPMSPVGESVCLRCHTGENSPDFDFKTYLEKIKH